MILKQMTVAAKETAQKNTASVSGDAKKKSVSHLQEEGEEEEEMEEDEVRTRTRRRTRKKKREARRMKRTRRLARTTTRMGMRTRMMTKTVFRRLMALLFKGGAKEQQGAENSLTAVALRRRRYAGRGVMRMRAC